jgi:hypothetical protein
MSTHGPCVTTSPADVVEEHACAIEPYRRRHAGLGLRQLDVLERRQHRQQEEALEDEADLLQAKPASLGIRERPDVAPFEPELTASRRVHASEHVQQRGLAAPRRPDQPEDLAPRGGQRHVPQRDDVPEALRDGACLDRGGAGADGSRLLLGSLQRHLSRAPFAGITPQVRRVSAGWEVPEALSQPACPRAPLEFA